jgi:NAD(P)-dependent dehydrogenase (short-subunit alcohol dehydrogenase family)
MSNYIIIGGSSGIGKALVSTLAGPDDRVFATYHQNPLENHGNVSYHPFDVLKDSFPLEQVPEEIHGLAYCPGSINLKPFHRFREEDFLEDYKLQVLGAASVIQQLLPRLKASGNSSIVLFSTIAVQQGFHFHSQVAMSKGAIEGLARALAAELAPGIRVNAIAPSLTDTSLASRLLNTPEKARAQAERNPLKKVGEAKDIAEAAYYLLTPKSSWVTGQILHVDGGYSRIKS